MRELLARTLHGLARRIYNEEHLEHIEVRDEYGVCRCSVDVVGDCSHGVNAVSYELPADWDCFVDGKVWK